MLVVFHNRHHPKIKLPEAAIRQPGERARAIAVRIVAYIVVVSLVAFVAWTAYDVGRQQAGYDSSQARKLRRELNLRLAEVEDERDELLQRVASLQRALQIDREAARQVRQSLLDLQDERLQLKEEIAFLGSLMQVPKAIWQSWKILRRYRPGVFRPDPRRRFSDRAHPKPFAAYEFRRPRHAACFRRHRYCVCPLFSATFMR